MVEVEGDPDALELAYRTHQLGDEGVHGQREQPRLLLLEDLRHRPVRAVGTGSRVRYRVAPAPGPAVEILERREVHALEEGLPHVTDGPLHLALLVALARRTGTGLEVVVRAELDQPRVEVHTAALPLQHRRFEVVVEDHRGTPVKKPKAATWPEKKFSWLWSKKNSQVQRPRVAERHHEAGQTPPGPAHQHLAEVRPVHLGLLAGQADQAQEGLLHHRTQPSHHAAQPLDRAHVPALPDHLQQPRGAQLRVAAPASRAGTPRRGRAGSAAVDEAGAAGRSRSPPAPCRGARSARRRSSRSSSARRSTGVGWWRASPDRASPHPVNGSISVPRRPQTQQITSPTADWTARQHQRAASVGAAGFIAATLIRHAPRDYAPAVLSLAIAVIEPPFRTPLVPAIGRSPLLPPRFVPTSLRAVPLATIAAAAHVEQPSGMLRPGRNAVVEGLAPCVAIGPAGQGSTSDHRHGKLQSALLCGFPSWGHTQNPGRPPRRPGFRFFARRPELSPSRPTRLRRG